MRRLAACRIHCNAEINLQLGQTVLQQHDAQSDSRPASILQGRSLLHAGNAARVGTLQT